MATLAEHATVKRFQDQQRVGDSSASLALESEWLRRLCLDAGADDVGFVEVGRPELADQHAEIVSLLPTTKALISFVLKMNRENIRTPARSIANVEFHTTHEIDEVARRIVAALEAAGVRALNGGAAGFPMEADRWGAKMWTISHKPVAVAAGLGHMGIHRNVIQPMLDGWPRSSWPADVHRDVGDGWRGAGCSIARRARSLSHRESAMRVDWLLESHGRRV